MTSTRPRTSSTERHAATSCPSTCGTSEGRRAALKEAKQKLEAERAENQQREEPRRPAEPVAPVVKIELDPEVIVARKDGRDAWLREARHQLDEHRRRQAKPIPAHAPNGSWRQSDAFSRTSKPSGPRTRR